MITVTRLNGSHFAVNPDLIERIHENPDTTLVLVDGSTFIITESLAEVVSSIAEYRARVIALAFAAGQTALAEQATHAGHATDPGALADGADDAAHADAVSAENTGEVL